LTVDETADHHGVASDGRILDSYCTMTKEGQRILGTAKRELAPKATLPLDEQQRRLAALMMGQWAYARWRTSHHDRTLRVVAVRRQRKRHLPKARVHRLPVVLVVTQDHIRGLQVPSTQVLVRSPQCELTQSSRQQVCPQGHNSFPDLPLERLRPSTALDLANEAIDTSAEHHQQLRLDCLIVAWDKVFGGHGWRS
jgi:hypothetical protein